jgi:hypothetical protein
MTITGRAQRRHDLGCVVDEVAERSFACAQTVTAIVDDGEGCSRRFEQRRRLVEISDDLAVAVEEEHRRARLGRRVLSQMQPGAGHVDEAIDGAGGRRARVSAWIKQASVELRAVEEGGHRARLRAFRPAVKSQTWILHASDPTAEHTARDNR